MQGGITYEFVNAVGERLRELEGECQVPGEEEGDSGLQRFVVESYPKLLSHLDRYRHQVESLVPLTASEDPPNPHEPKSVRRTLKRLERDRDRLVDANVRLMEENERLQRSVKRFAVFEEETTGEGESNESRLSRLLIMNALKKAIVQRELEFTAMVQSKDQEIQQLRDSAEEEFKSTAVEGPQEVLLAAEGRVETDTLSEETQVEDLIVGSEVAVQTEKRGKGKKGVTKGTQTSSLYLLKTPSELHHAEVQTDSQCCSTLESYSQTDQVPSLCDESTQVSPTPLPQATQTDLTGAALASTQTPAPPPSLSKSVQTTNTLDLSIEFAGVQAVTPDSKRVSTEGRLSETRVAYHSPSERAYKQLYQEKCRECEDLRVLLFRPVPVSPESVARTPFQSTLRIRVDDTPHKSPPVQVSPISPVHVLDFTLPSDASGFGGKDATPDSLAKLRAKEREMLEREQRVRRREMLLDGQVREGEQKVGRRRKPDWVGSLTDR